MRKPFMAGNWKMYKTIDEAVALVEQLKGPLSEIDSVTSGVCPPFVAIPAVREVLRGTNIKVGAQNMFWEDEGAYTGEVSPVMLKGIADMVIIGHSERRQYFGETDETVNKKLKAALKHGLLPIVAVGESLEQNEAGETESWVSGQVRAAFDGISAEQARGVVVAYEPIWAIGTGRAATPEQANSIIGGVVRATLADLYGDDVAQAMIIQYGGSIKPSNVRELMEQPEIDGGLVGGASLKAEDFIELVRVTAEVKG
ncbi:MAG TPA: triose-phosphate isomerase [Aggregatilineales bacterium]|nr:triose-phosphate isomerase [Chloroflexota bacterium]HOA24196.1 triose-phosphate isomerase [Aggregatilineales bacterium]HPV07691.1 triose-phosphate isomerase [Aggregatilineales bacterium]HQA67245.1 triose-phosphate isomerase [Aggregatilineales bacterium]HQE17053.1 triose-phosphate isomerase [Aggregatilineales bacterium]